MKKRSRLVTVLLIIVLIVGIGLIFYNQIESFIISKLGKDLSLDKYSVEDLEKNNDMDASFDFDAVQTLSILDVLEAQANAKNMPVIGSLVIPDVDMKLPILKGVSNYAMAVGAGTMKPEQKMGQGNYALASHFVQKRENILFGPLYRAKKGDEIFLTDLKNIYEYKISDIKVIQPTDVYVIDDIKDKTLLTLITCAEEGTKRLSVQAEFVTSYPFDEAPKELNEAF